MAAETAFGRVYDCQIEDCDREAETSQYVNTPRGRGEISTCFPCAEAIRVGERSVRNDGWRTDGGDLPVEFQTAREATQEGPR